MCIRIIRRTYKSFRFLSRSSPSSFEPREGLPPHLLPASYWPPREKWISSSKTPAAEAYLLQNGLLRLIQRRTTRYIYIYTRTGISRVERSHKPTLYIYYTVYIYIARLIATNGLPAIHSDRAVKICG